MAAFKTASNFAEWPIKGRIAASRARLNKRQLLTPEREKADMPPSTQKAMVL